MADESEGVSHGRGIAGTMEVEQVEWEKCVECLAAVSCVAACSSQLS